MLLFCVADVKREEVVADVMFVRCFCVFVGHIMVDYLIDNAQAQAQVRALVRPHQCFRCLNKSGYVSAIAISRSIDRDCV